MKRSTRAIITFVAVGVARAADLATTYHFTPDLRQEANPLALLTGSDQMQFLSINVIAVGGLLFLPLCLYWRYPPLAVPAASGSMREFISWQIYGTPLSTARFFRAVLVGVPPPVNWRQFFRMIGVVMSWTVVCGSMLAVLSWWATRAWDCQAYQSLRSAFGEVAGYPVMELLACLPASMFFAWLHFRAEREEVRKMTLDEASNLNAQLL